MTIQNRLRLVFLGATLLLGIPALAQPAFAASSEIEQFVGDEPTAFATPEEAVAAFKAALAGDDLDGLAKLLGLDSARLKKVDGLGERLAEIKLGASRLLNVQEDGDQRIINIGFIVWPFPFPIVKGEDGKWAFDTYAGLEEIVNRRVGENEIQAIDTVRGYVEAQRDYAVDDYDADGVLEYAQKLVSTEGLTDGLYWPPEQGDGESPFGAGIDQAALDKAKAGDGYFGYKFRILRGQGNNIAGKRYDYVINGNMIAGFGLVAWPVKYAHTGVKTFVVNHAGIVYEKDLGPGTAKRVEEIRRFNPDATWSVVKD